MYVETLQNHVFQKPASSSPRRMQLQGTLIPCNELYFGERFRFKLETRMNEYYLKMNNGMEITAKRLEWEEVTVSGYLDPDSKMFVVERILNLQKPDSVRMSLGLDSVLDVDHLRTIINRYGKLEPASA
jgi:hypothetical protein